MRLFEEFCRHVYSWSLPNNELLIAVVPRYYDYVFLSAVHCFLVPSSWRTLTYTRTFLLEVLESIIDVTPYCTLGFVTSTAYPS